MSYLGKVDMNDANIKHYSLTGSTLTTVNIGWTPASEQSLRVTINGVVQQGDTFSYSGANLTLGGPLVATDTLEVVGIESVGTIITPADNSVTTTKLADDSVTLAKMAGLARGKIIVGDSSGDPSALTVGASTQILTSDGTDAAWAAPAATTSDIELLNTYEPSGVAEVEITTASYFSATYSSLIFKFINMQPVTDNVHLRWGMGTGVGPTYNSSFSGGFAINQAHLTSGNWQQDTAYFANADNFTTLFKEVGNGAAENCSGNLEVFNLSSTTFEKMYNSFVTGHLYHDYQTCVWNTGRYANTAAITAIKFYFNSGNIANGTIKVYGTR